jgi:L-ascorbate metabolism protein UlaG (beta-lactamase superfamily)
LSIGVRNFVNGFVALERDGRTLLGDPWITPGIFDGGWEPYPPLRAPDMALARCEYLHISHIHEDHFDPPALARLPHDGAAVVPDLFPNHLIQDRLQDLGFRDVRMAKPFEPIRLAADLEVEVIPPLNAFHQERELYGRGRPFVAIDSGLFVTWGGVRILLLNDNSPYDIGELVRRRERYERCDLLAVNYNGAADDFPICYRGLSDDEKRAICDRRDAVKLEAIRTLVGAVKPRLVMPYSSEFSVRGRQALPFATVRRSWSNDKRQVAEWLTRETGGPAVALFEGDLLSIAAGGGVALSRADAVAPTVLERAACLASEVTNYAERFPESPEIAVLADRATGAARHMFQYMDRRGIATDWVLVVHVGEDLLVSVDLRDRAVSAARPADGRRQLRVFADPRYLNALLTRQSHWNNAMISFNLEWHRVPNQYDHPLYLALNFFHL